jgi:hypothetical protein
MNYNEINNKLTDIYNEDNIWIIYILIIIASWYSNSLEKDYFLYNDINCKNKYREVMIKIFTILLIAYFYFFISSMKDVNALKPTDTLKKRKLTELSAIGSLFIVVSGLIFLYIAYMDQDIDVEIAFN